MAFFSRSPKENLAITEAGQSMCLKAKGNHQNDARKQTKIYCQHYYYNHFTDLWILFGTRKANQEGKTNLDLLEQEIVSGSGISWDICKSACCSRQKTMLASHHSSFLQTGCPSCRPTNR